MKLDTSFDEIQGTLLLCLRCRECTWGDWPNNYRLCPIHNYHKIYTSSAGGIISIMIGLSQGKIDYNQAIADLAYQCRLCGFCNVCEVIPLRPPHNSTTDLIRFLRYQLVKRGIYPGEGLKKLHEAVKKDSECMENAIKSSADQKCDYVLFAGCRENSEQQNIERAIAQLLDRCGIKADVFAPDDYCGSTLYDMGFWDELNTLLQKQSAAIAKLRGKEVIFASPHCQEFMTKKYPTIVQQSFEIKGKHISEVLLDALTSGKLQGKNKENIKVSYHDPCYLGRELGIYDAPRKVISSLKGVELIEMKRIRENSYCCGAGGNNTGKSFPEISQSVAKDRLAEFKETGADLLITACPYCKETFQSVLPDKEKAIVKDISELVCERTC